MHKLNEDLFQNALDLNETIVFEYDIEHDVMNFANNVGKYMPVTTVVPNYLEDLEIRGKIYPEDSKKAIAFFKSTADDTELLMEYIRCLNFEGEYPWYQVKGKLISDGEGRPVLLYGTFTCVEGNETSEELKSTIDPLTRLFNREYSITKINNYFREMADDAIPNLLLIDVDNFMSIREKVGDSKADGTLLEVGRVLKRALRGTDIIGRYGKDQFIVCMKGVREEKIFCERATYIMDSVKTVWQDYKDHDKVSVSIGIGITAAGAEADFSVLWDKSCKALKEAKDANRDTFVLYSDVMKDASDFKNVSITSREFELVKGILDPVMTWAYAVDENYNIVYANKALADRLGGECEGLCYAKIKGYDSPCPDCPIHSMTDHKSNIDSVCYSPYVRGTVNIRTTRLTLRNKSKLYIVSNVKDDMKLQMEKLKESSERSSEASIKLHNIVWDVNISKNTAVRLNEDEILVNTQPRVENFQTLRSMYLDKVVYPEDRDAFSALLDPLRIREASKLGMDKIQKQLRLMTPDGYQWFDAKSLITPASREHDEAVFFTANNINVLRNDLIKSYTVEQTFSSVKNLNKFQQELVKSNERYENVSELTGIYMFEYDVNTSSFYFNATFDSIFYFDESYITDEWSLLETLRAAREDYDKFERFKARLKGDDDVAETTVRLYTKYGASVWFTISAQKLHGLNNSLVRVLYVLQNVNNEMSIKTELEFRADFDSATGLYNAEYFYQNAAERINLNPDKQYCIVSLDIKRFRIINDRFGVESGNACLEYLGEIIRDSLPYDFLAARYQSDSCTVLYEYETDQQIAEYMDGLTNSFKYEDAISCGSSLCFGIYKIHNRTIPVRLMCDRARMAKREIKGNAFVNFAVYDDKLRLVMREQAEIEAEMRQALENREFIMYLQPKYDAKTEKICGAEALVRWKHPIKGIRMPGDFLPLFENNGFVKNLDVYMWEECAAYLKKIKDQYDIKIPISVNISRVHINNTDLVPTIINIVKKYDIEPQLMELEITESFFMDDEVDLFNVMKELKAAGFIIEMDDFGSGYSSLNMLRQAPVDVIKIDRFFLDEIMTTTRGRIIVENSIIMSKQLGLTVVAEGVENVEQLEFVRNAGADIVQGYYYSKPIPTDEFERKLKEERGI